MKSTMICSIEDCESLVMARSWCSKHYQRWYKYGDPLLGREYYTTSEERWNAHTVWHGGCLIWVAGKTTVGYGVMWHEGRNYLVHRYAWEREYGPIPEGLNIDHKDHCELSCVNVEHLRLATHRENMANRSGADKSSKSGVRNITIRNGSHFVRIQNTYYGSYKTLEEAIIVRDKKRKEIFGEFAGKG